MVVDGSALKELARRPPERSVAIRPSDDQQLACLLYLAYRGTTEDEGERVLDDVDEVHRTRDGAYGALLPDGYRWLYEAGESASAILATLWCGAPFIAFVATHPLHTPRASPEDSSPTSPTPLSATATHGSPLSSPTATLLLTFTGGWVSSPLHGRRKHNSRHPERTRTRHDHLPRHG